MIRMQPSRGPWLYANLQACPETRRAAARSGCRARDLTWYHATVLMGRMAELIENFFYCTPRMQSTQGQGRLTYLDRETTYLFFSLLSICALRRCDDTHGSTAASGPE